MDKSLQNTIKVLKVLWSYRKIISVEKMLPHCYSIMYQCQSASLQYVLKNKNCKPDDDLKCRNMLLCK
jgi:hypothetical protein